MSAPGAATRSRIVAASRKLACLFWVLLWRQQDYVFGQPSLTANKLRQLEITAGAPRWRDAGGVWAANRALRDAERDLARRVWHLLQPDPATTIPTNTPNRPTRPTTIHCNRPTGTPQLT